jgi:hypothetical protein
MLVTKSRSFVAPAEPAGSDYPEVDRFSAHRAAEVFVLKHLKHGAAGMMSDQYESELTQLDETTFNVRGWVNTRKWLCSVVRRNYDVTMVMRKGPVLVETDASLMDVLRNGLFSVDYHWAALSVSVN